MCDRYDGHGWWGRDRGVRADRKAQCKREQREREDCRKDSAMAVLCVDGASAVHTDSDASLILSLGSTRPTHRVDPPFCQGLVRTHRRRVCRRRSRADEALS